MNTPPLLPSPNVALRVSAVLVASRSHASSRVTRVSPPLISLAMSSWSSGGARTRMVELPAEVMRIAAAFL
jgi:hypothetical protein